MRIPKKGLVLANGNRLSQGQLFPKRENTMADNGQRAAMQRAMTPNLARDGAPKKITTPEIAHGMTRQTKPSHEFLHGSPIDDEPVQNSWGGKGNVPTHPGMVTQPKSNAGDRLRGTHDREAGNAILQEAARLGNTK